MSGFTKIKQTAEWFLMKWQINRRFAPVIGELGTNFPRETFGQSYTGLSRRKQNLNSEPESLEKVFR
jgi:hypothetical protein